MSGHGLHADALTDCGSETICHQSHLTLIIMIITD